jgi:hypothetical protein
MPSTTCSARLAAAGLELQFEIALLAFWIAGDFGTDADVDPELRRPSSQRRGCASRVPASNRRASAAAAAGLGHHVLALLVAVDGVGELRRGFEQHVREAGSAARAAAERPPGPEPTTAIL